MASSYYCVLLLIGIFELTNAQHITKFSVPPQEAHEALLICQYNLNDVKLYDAKWYKDDQNFFKCSEEGVQQYPVAGVTIESWEPMASSCSITLTGLTSQSSGVYRCEVTLDTPAFTTLSKRGELRVTFAAKRVQNLESTTMPPEHMISQSSSTSESNNLKIPNTILTIVTYLLLRLI